ncbi:MAG: penicillin acylase family protein [Armatimonadota bacterium]
MRLSSTEILRRLGAGVSIASICADAALTRAAFDEWWTAELASRVSPTSGTLPGPWPGSVEILRDRWGIPHIVSRTDEALFFGFGFAMAQDRLWQMDYLRRRALGRLAEILGPEGLSLDIVARTVGIPRIARAHLEQLPTETLTLLERVSAGVNACMEQRRGRLPIEFALLDYGPEPWAPLDSIAILGEFRWYLTGRLFVIAIPELAKRTLWNDALYHAFLTPEAGSESIMPPGSYSPSPPREPVAGGSGAPDDGGSNNWAVAGSHSVTGRPLLASDPHIAFGTTSCWHQVHLCGESFNAAGMAYVGVPAMIMGRNERVAWGITNNICSQRDLYQERTDPQHPDCFLYDDRWEPARDIVEEIAVRGGPSVRKVIRLSRNGPIVDELLPEPTQDTGPVALRWMGAEFCDETTCALRASRARTGAEFREALRDWRSPTWSFAYADVDGHIGYQSVGRIPIRENWNRGYRPGWDPDHLWTAYIPYDKMPAEVDPPSGWVRSANNRPAPPDFPYPLSNTSSSGHRALRIRQMLEERERFALEDFARMQLDTLSLRAVEAIPPLLTLLDGAIDDRLHHAAGILRTWNRRMNPDEVGAALFEVFFNRWCQEVAAEHFPQNAVALIAGAAGGLALALLSEDPHGWFVRRQRSDAVIEAWRRTIDDLESRLGPDMTRWTWGRVHTMTLRHVLSGRGDLAQLLDRGGDPVRGSGVTVCNTGYDPNYMASIGANYRLIVDLASTPPSLWSVDAAGVSGDQGSAHYCDQLPEWLAGRHHDIVLDRERIERESVSRFVFESTRG